MCGGISSTASRELAKMSRVMSVEYSLFQNSLEIVLKDAVDDHTLSALLDLEDSPVTWQDESIDHCVRRTLGRS
ncbi:hypothetical protein DOTSEDRAFT_75811 [Dothistroma septosporum NZE10]|uniref:Uncharacterized protein n=1 Tax=Dothistroma septosporum (strain NZE10 / CBS 128990) TaxID=675120 RepID=N1PBR4_DOTSN|nr:hypothetical protein DOTSEDRAFT_75811 [Dothistroma septosporum NZE10]